MKQGKLWDANNDEVNHKRNYENGKRRPKDQGMPNTKNNLHPCHKSQPSPTQRPPITHVPKRPGREGCHCSSISLRIDGLSDLQKDHRPLVETNAISKIYRLPLPLSNVPC